MESELRYESAATIHKIPLAALEDQDAPEFIDSNLYKKLASTTFTRVDLDGNPIESKQLDLDKGSIFTNLKDDYEYLMKWYHNPYRKANTRHGWYIMLYDIDGTYTWKVNDWFVNKLLNSQDIVDELFEF